MLTAVRRAIADHLKPYLGLDPTAQSNPSHMQALAESTQITHTAALDSLGPPARRIRARDGAPVLCSPSSSPSGAAPPTSTLEEEAQLQLALARSEAEAAAPPPPPPTATPTTTPAAMPAAAPFVAAGTAAPSKVKEAFTARRMRRRS